MPYRILIQPRAARALEKLPREIQQRLKSAISSLAATPRPRGSKRLEGERDTWRARVGRYRVVYVLDDATQTVTVTVISHRRDVYRG